MVEYICPYCGSDNVHASLYADRKCCSACHKCGPRKDFIAKLKTITEITIEGKMR